MMKINIRIIIILILFFAVNSVFAQSDSNNSVLFNYAIKNNFQYFYQNKLNSAEFQLIAPSFFLRTRSGNAHEFELSQLVFWKSDTRDKGFYNASLHKNFFIAIRYQYNYYFIKRPVKFSPYLGATVLSNFEVFNTKPEKAGQFESKFTGFGTTVALAPGINYNISKRVFLDFNIPLEFYSFNYNQNKIENPTLTNNEKKHSETKNDMPLEDILKFRFGLGINF